MLFTPGPVDLTLGVIESQRKQMISHRDEAFREMFAECAEALKSVFGTSGFVFTITGSGSTANEAALANGVYDAKTLCLVNGEFGERLYDAAKIYNPQTEHLVLEDSKGFSLERVKAALDEKKPDVLALVHNDTAVGVENKVKEIASYAHAQGIRVLVDAVSSLAGTDLRMDEWGVDICTSASQKSLSCPPGFGFVALNEETMQWVEKKPSVPTYCHDLKRYKKFYEKRETPYTPAVSVFYALQQALRELGEGGLDNRITAHKKAAAKVRSAVKESGFSVFAETGFESNTITGFLTDQAKEIKERLAEQGVHIAGGQGKWKGKMLRIANMGSMEIENIDVCLEVLRKTCRK